MFPRWAAKEAAIKAHTNRRLLRKQVSILIPSQHVAFDLGVTVKPDCLIEPPRSVVIMDRLTAIKRGLKDIASETTMACEPILRCSTPDERLRAIATLAGIPFQEPIFVRQLLTTQEERRVADLSISHDGNYAVAVCMALNEDWEETPPPVIDSGEGKSIHEPQLGDLGFGLQQVF